MMVPLWVILVGPLAVALIVALGNWLVLSRLNYYASVLLKNAIDATEERKSVALATASTLADKQAGVADVLSKKVEVTADVLSKKVEDAAAALAGKVEEGATQLLVTIQEDLKGVHKRLHLLEGSTAGKEKEIEAMLDKHEAAVIIRAPITSEVAAKLLNDPKEKQ